MSTPDDAVLPFRLARSNMRGRVVRLGDSLQTILDQHRYPGRISALMSEAMLLTVLIGQTVPNGWKFSLQIRGTAGVHLIATDYMAPKADGEPGRIRAYAGFDAGEVASSRADAFDLLGKGVFGVTIDQGPGTKPYQGITPLAGGSLAACAETYFAQSEQLATRFALIGAEAQEPGENALWRAGGLMIQQMPEAGGRIPDAPSGEDGLMSADDAAAMGGREDDWNRVNMLMQTIEAHELIGPHVSPETLLLRLFHEEDPSVFSAQNVEFGCTCSADRVRAAMYQYSAKDIAHMTTDEGTLTADCQFCGAHYVFDPKTLGFEADEQSGSDGAVPS